MACASFVPVTVFSVTWIGITWRACLLSKWRRGCTLLTPRKAGRSLGCVRKRDGATPGRKTPGGDGV